MSLREKIILAAAGIAVLFGIYEFGLKNIFQKKQGSSQEIKSQTETDQNLLILTDQISASVSSVNLDKKEILIISKSREKIKKDPFISFNQMEAIEKKDIEDKKPEEDISFETLFKYLGYIEIGSLKIAVINNLEYKKNEQIENSGYILKDISPSRVILSDKIREIEIFNEETKTRVK